MDTRLKVEQNIHEIKMDDKNKRCKVVIEMKEYIKMIVEEYKILSGREFERKRYSNEQWFLFENFRKRTLLEEGKMKEFAATFKGKLLWLCRKNLET